MSCYKINRERVFQIYGININDHNFNCHHIVTREDVKNGLVSSNFDLNAASNLFPIRVRDHNQIHRYLHLLEKKPDKTPIRVNLKPLPIIKPDLKENIAINIIDSNFLSFIKQRNVQQKSSPIKFLVWRRQGVL